MRLDEGKTPSPALTQGGHSESRVMQTQRGQQRERGREKARLRTEAEAVLRRCGAASVGNFPRLVVIEKGKAQRPQRAGAYGEA